MQRRSLRVTWRVCVPFACACVLEACTHPASVGHSISAPQMVDSVLVAPTELVVDESVPAGEIDGVVVDAYSGKPVYGASLVPRYAASAHPVYTLADADGHFHLVGLHLGRTIVRVSRVGYGTDSVVVSGDSGYVARIGLRAHRMFIPCDLVITSEPAPAVTVFVHDVRTGNAPTVRVTLKLTDGHFADSASASENISLPLELGAARGRDGRYDVVVSAPGYRRWHVRNVRTKQDGECHPYQGRALQVWLVPEAEAAQPGTRN